MYDCNFGCRKEIVVFMSVIVFDVLFLKKYVHNTLCKVHSVGYFVTLLLFVQFRGNLNYI